MWLHKGTYAKWQYNKDPNAWYDFYTPLHNPPANEKIINYYFYYSGSNTYQLWAL